MKYRIVEQTQDAEGNNVEVLLGESDFIGARQIKRFLLNTIRDQIKAEGNTVKITISNRVTFRDFVIQER